MAKSSHKIRLHAAPDHVCQALTTQAGLQSWFTPHVEGQVSEGHEVKMSFSGKEPFRWRMSAFKPATHVHWECLEGPGSVKGAYVTYTLDGQGGQTLSNKWMLPRLASSLDANPDMEVRLVLDWLRGERDAWQARQVAGAVSSAGLRLIVKDPQPINPPDEAPFAGPLGHS